MPRNKCEATGMQASLVMQDQASSLANGVHALQHQLEQLHFTDQDADQELSPIRQDVQKISQDLSRSAKKLIIVKAPCSLFHFSICATLKDNV